MTTKHAVSNSDDVIDSRDVIARIEELESLMQDAADDENAETKDTDDNQTIKFNADFGLDEYDELRALQSLADEASGSPDWKYGEALIRDSYFERYAMELADDIGAINHDASWPNTCIDWDRAARELQQDYTQVDFDGVEYWIRS